jgi:hypothetical protein
MLAAVAALPQLAAAAKTPYAQYGALEEVYSFCAKVVPTQASYFQQRGNAILASVSSIPSGQQNPEYERGHQVLAQSLQQLPTNEAVDACRAIGLSATPTSKNPKPQSRPRHD